VEEEDGVVGADAARLCNSLEGTEAYSDALLIGTILYGRTETFNTADSRFQHMIRPYIAEFAPFLRFLRSNMAENGVLTLNGCLAGKGAGGDALLGKLSQVLNPRKVVGFITVGYSSVEKQRPSDDKCDFDIRFPREP
jgi:hypothetical protein